MVPKLPASTFPFLINVRTSSNSLNLIFQVPFKIAVVPSGNELRLPSLRYEPARLDDQLLFGIGEFYEHVYFRPETPFVTSLIDECFVSMCVFYDLIL